MTGVKGSLYVKMAIMSDVPMRYQLSFTFGGLLVTETRTIAEAYRAIGNWPAVSAAVIDDNLLAKTRTASSRRYFREIRDRLQRAYSWELDIIAGTGDGVTNGEIPTVLFALFTRCYRLVGDFMTEVVRPRIHSGLPTVDAAMFRAFVGDRSTMHRELTQISDATRAKLTEIAFKSMREAGIITGRLGPFTVTPPSLSAGMRDRYCYHGTSRDLTHLLWTDKEIQRCLK